MDKVILEKLKELQQKANEIIKTPATFEGKSSELDFSKLSVEERHNKYIGWAKKFKPTFKDKDVVEIEENLIDENFRENAWKNINIFTFDIPNFFINSCVFNLIINNKVGYKMYFSIEEGNDIFLYAEDMYENSIGGGAITIKDNKFLPVGAVTDVAYEIYVKNHIEEGLPTDRQTVANRFLMNCLLYFLLVNELFHRSKEVVTETTRRIDVAPKKSGKKKKKQPKKTKQIRYSAIRC